MPWYLFIHPSNIYWTSENAGEPKQERSLGLGAFGVLRERWHGQGHPRNHKLAVWSVLLRGQEAGAGTGARNGLREGLSRWEPQACPALRSQSGWECPHPWGEQLSQAPCWEGCIEEVEEGCSSGGRECEKHGAGGGFALYKAWETGEHFHL